MKRTILAILLSFFLPYPAFSDSINLINPQGAENWSILTKINWNFDGDLDFDGSNFVQSGSDIEIDDHYKINAIAVFGITDEIDLYAGIGISDFSIDGNLASYGKMNIDADTDIAYIAGIKSLFFIDSGYYAGIDFQYEWSNNDADIELSSGNYDGDIDYEKWHIAPYIARPYETYSPYAGIRYTSIEYKADFSGLGKIDFENDNEIGIFIGSDFNITDNISGNIEIGFLDQTSISTSINYKF